VKREGGNERSETKRKKRKEDEDEEEEEVEREPKVSLPRFLSLMFFMLLV